MLKSEKKKKNSNGSGKVSSVFWDNPSQNISLRFTKLSKMTLFMESSIGDLFKFSSTISRFSFLEGGLGYGCR